MNPSIELGPILRAMRHHKGAFSLLVLEVALGFVMLTHTLISARYYYRLHVQPTGMQEDQLVIARRRFLRPRDVDAARAAARADLAALAPVGPAAAIDTEPLPDAATFPAVLTPPAPGRAQTAWPLRATPGIAAALGLDVVFGTALDGAAGRPRGDGVTPVLLTWSTAEAMFGTADAAVGKPIDGSAFGPGRVAGVVRDFQFRGSWFPSPNATVIVSAEPLTEHEVVYIIHAPPGGRASVLAAAQAALARVGDADSTSLVTGLEPARMRYAQLSQGAVIILIWTGFLVVAVALAGSLALSSFSVAERTRQIGVRRALGANRGEIVRYFLFENVLLTMFGLVLGLGLAIGFNHMLRGIMADLRLSADEVLISMAIFIVTGLLSALVPARRAALIPPWAATRTL